jgi:adenosylcobyric acid synthase
VGTFAVVAPEDAARIVAIVINKFQGDPSLFEDGRAFIQQHTARRCFGPLPMFADASKLPAEDALALAQMPVRANGEIKIAVPRLGRIANFDDLDPLRAEPDVSVIIVQPGTAIPRDIDLIILPGSKATIADLAFVRHQGWDIDLMAHARAGGSIFGICGGYQMLGKSIADPEGVEGDPGAVKGLGLLDVDTILAPAKQLRLEQAIDTLRGERLSGYHMHMGVTTGVDTLRPFSHVGALSEGAIDKTGRIIGTYLHGVFAADGFRRAFLKTLGQTQASTLNYAQDVEQILNALAAHMEAHLDLDAFLALSKRPRVD